MSQEFQQRYKSELASLQPSGRFARGLELAISRYAPGFAMRREQTRASLARFRAQGALPNAGRANAGPFEGNPFQRQREQKQLLWNALDLVDNSGLAESITGKYALYTCGSLRYQARTGDKHINAAYEAYIREKTGSCIDITGRSTLRELAMIAIRGRIVKGGAVFELLRPYPDDPNIYLRGIEYDRIGSPYDFRIAPNFVGGIHLDALGRECAMDIYSRDRMGGSYVFEDMVPVCDDYGRRQVFHIFRPQTFDQYKGVTAFKTAIDNIHYIDQIRKFELQAMQWAATQTAIYYTGTGELPPRPFEERVDAQGRQTRIVNVGGPELSAMEVGEDVKMFESQRPSPNVINMFLNTINEVCIAIQFPMTFVYGMNGTGPGVRFDGAQANRGVGAEFASLDERMLTPVFAAILLNGIRNGDIPYHPLHERGRVIGPKKPSIDAGDDSAAFLNENKEGATSRATWQLDRGVDEDEEADQIQAEAEDWIERAKTIAKRQGIADWQLVLPMLRQSSGASAGIAPSLPSPVTVPAPDPNAGASSDGVEVE